MDRSSHDYVEHLIGKDVLSRKVEHHELEGGEGDTYLVQLDETIVRSGRASGPIHFGGPST